MLRPPDSFTAQIPGRVLGKNYVEMWTFQLSIQEILEQDSQPDFQVAHFLVTNAEKPSHSAQAGGEAVEASLWEIQVRLAGPKNEVERRQQSLPVHACHIPPQARNT